MTERVWIVGASSGIGEALVREWLQHDVKLIISARRASCLEQLAELEPEKVIALPLDITEGKSVIDAATEIGRSGGVDRIVINAGTCEYLDAEDIDLKMVRRVMETNFFGAVSVVKAGLPLLRQAASAGNKHRPELVFVSSSVTYQALPRAGAYGASKAALRYFAEALYCDLQHEGISVRVVSPGFVRTPLTDLNDFPMPFLIEPDEAARRIVSGLSGKRFDIHFPGRFTWWLKAIAMLPGRIRWRVAGRLSRHREQSGQPIN
ncbi:MAG: SDR family NAD(P)-dependent oxidoreductase [Pseudomonadales bacterium]|nr:SDR family NAD(P)-dependent oxidoreductase [Pseudomonadales bacterium]